MTPFTAECFHIAEQEIEFAKQRARGGHKRRQSIAFITQQQKFERWNKFVAGLTDGERLQTLTTASDRCVAVLCPTRCVGVWIVLLAVSGCVLGCVALWLCPEWCGLRVSRFCVGL